jgi:hypothetical protein
VAGAGIERQSVDAPALDERKHDVDRIKETVGSSLARLVPLLDVHPPSSDDVSPFSPVLEGLRDGVRQPSPVRGELRDNLEESSHDVKKS